ncbi:MAG: adenylosuccinate lyase, partial [Pyrinomonadaceae bacterium]|nr:adenylosuccinate lyase [Pyrinomonadaceae bacterium]
MIARYTLPEMGALWSEQNKFQKWLEVEIAVCEVHAGMGTIPRAALEQIRESAAFTVERINEIEKTTDHDVIAFTTALAENIGEAARFVHYGLTSSDVVDTANALLLRDACELLLAKIDALLVVLKRRAFEFKETPQIGRTHGIHAEPTSFGLTFALWYDEMRRNRERLERARAAVAVGKISGAVGAFAHLDPIVEEKVCERLGLKPAPVSTQVIQRDNYAEYLCTLAVVAASIEKFALQVRHWQRTEVREAEEKFKQGQKGSSAMPHKRNP